MLKMFYYFWEDLGPIIIFFNISEKPRVYTGITFLNIFYAPILQSWAFLFMDRYWYHRSDTYILLPINVGPRIEEG